MKSSKSAPHRIIFDIWDGAVEKPGSGSFRCHFGRAEREISGSPRRQRRAVNCEFGCRSSSTFKRPLSPSSPRIFVPSCHRRHRRLLVRLLQHASPRRHHAFIRIVSYLQWCGGPSTYPSCALPAHALPTPHAPRAAKVQNELKPYRPARPVMLCVWFQNTSDGPALAFPAPDLLRRLGQSSSPAAASR